MRQWLNLFEDALYSEVEAASQFHLGYPLHGNEAEHFYGTSDTKELVNIIHDDVHQLFLNGGGKATLYRLINVPDETVMKLQPGDVLGPLDKNRPSSWTTDWKEIEPTAIDINRHHDDIQNLFVITAEVPFAAVDLPLTIAQNIHLHWEREITLLRGHDIKLVSIHRAEPYGPAGEEMRPDLRGAMMES